MTAESKGRELFTFDNSVSGWTGRPHRDHPPDEGARAHGDAGGAEGSLIITRDEANGSIDSGRITRLIAEVVN